MALAMASSPKRVVVGVALPSEPEAPRVKVLAAEPVALSGVPGAFGVLAEHGAAAIAGDEDVVAHFGLAGLAIHSTPPR
jgi:hypothetical protein